MNKLSNINRVCDLYREVYPHMIIAKSGSRGSAVNWCECTMLDEPDWACFTSGDESYFFFKEELTAVQFALRWL